MALFPAFADVETNKVRDSSKGGHSFPYLSFWCRMFTTVINCQHMLECFVVVLFSTNISLSDVVFAFMRKAEHRHLLTRILAEHLKAVIYTSLTF